MAKRNAYTSLAHSRANYYIKGSPVQFVQVELLREESSGDILVTLTFKNLYQRLLTGCKIHFTCKNALGALIAEEDFSYEDLAVLEGELFGNNDAVFISAQPIASVEVDLVGVCFESGRWHDMTVYEKVRLAPLRPLAEEARAVLHRTLGAADLQYRPAQSEEGWQCTCGAFNYNAGKSIAVCSECGMDKTMLFSAMRDLESPRGEGTRVFSAVSPDAVRRGGSAASETRAFTPPTSVQQKAAAVQRTSARGGYSIMSDKTADFIVKFVPFIALGASSIYVIGALLMKSLFF
ncbi:MAG: hypothetical protein KBG54_03260 [Oscillospiraceae bacterium]|nr:hypothetical protein [Oscillospiraceae bacterium]